MQKQSNVCHTNLQNKTLCLRLCSNLQNETHCRLVTPLARLQKSMHKYIVSNSGWKTSPIINKQGEGVEKECSGMFWGKKIEKLISGWGWGGGHLLGTQEWVTHLVLKWMSWIFGSNKHNWKNENYHRILHIQINLDSKFQAIFNKQFWFLEQISKKVYFRSKTKQWTSLRNSSYSN